MKNKILLALCLTLLSHFIKAQQHPAQLDKKTISETVSNTCNLLTNYYVFPDKAEMMCTYINQQNKKGAYKGLTNQNQFADQLTTDLKSRYADKHLRIVYDPGLEKDLLNFLKSEQHANEIKQ